MEIWTTREHETNRQDHRSDPAGRRQIAPSQGLVQKRAIDLPGEQLQAVSEQPLEPPPPSRPSSLWPVREVGWQDIERFN